MTSVHRRLSPCSDRKLPLDLRNGDSWPKHGTSTLAAGRTSGDEHIFSTGYRLWF